MALTLAEVALQRWIDTVVDVAEAISLASTNRSTLGPLFGFSLSESDAPCCKHVVPELLTWAAAYRRYKMRAIEVTESPYCTNRYLSTSDSFNL